MQDSLQGNTRLVEGRTEADELLRRIESVPFSGWHARARVIVGSATFVMVASSTTMNCAKQTTTSAHHGLAPCASSSTMTATSPS